jgi:hypothetical protein
MKENNPLVEVFGYPTDDFSDEAHEYRENKLCPFNNKKAECTKVNVNNPLGACDVHKNGKPIITCPTRFTEDWLIAKHAARFFFSPGDRYRILQEVQLRDKDDNVAGNIDFVLAKIDDVGHIVDFGGVEVQSVYTQGGGMRDSFEHYMVDPAGRVDFDWRSYSDKYPRPDWRSSHKRLFQQFLFKGAIFRDWGKKQAVPIQTDFYRSLPDFTEVKEDQADMVWLIYDLQRNEDTGRWSLYLDEKVFTDFNQTIDEVEYIETGGPKSDFISALERKLDREPDSPDLTIDLNP